MTIPARKGFRAPLGMVSILVCILACLAWSPRGQAGPSVPPPAAHPAAPVLRIESVGPASQPASPQAPRPLSSPQAAALLQRLPRSTSRAVPVPRPAPSVPVPVASVTVPLGAATCPTSPEPARSREEGAPSPVPLGVTHHAPEGRLFRSEPPRIVFSQPMVTLDDSDAPVPATITPPLGGRWRWTDPCTAILDLPDQLPASTCYTVCIPKGTRSLEGGSLASNFQWTFTTLPPALVDSWPRGDEVSREPLLIAQFDVPMSPSDVRIEVQENRRPLPVVAVDPQALAHDVRVQELASHLSPGKWLAFRATRPLAAGARVRVRIACRGSLPGKAQEWSFGVAPGLKLLLPHAHPRHDARLPVMVTFNRLLRPGSLHPSAVQVVPPVPGLEIEAGARCLVLRQGFLPGRRYTVTLLPGCVSDLQGRTLERPQTLVVRTTPADSLPPAWRSRPYVDLPRGKCLTVSPRNLQAWPIGSGHVRSLRVQAWRVTTADWSRFAELTADEEKRSPAARGHEKCLPAAPDQSVPGTLVLDRHLPVRAQPGDHATTVLDLRPLLAQGCGHRIIRVSAPGATPQLVWIQASHLVARVALGHREVVAWVTSSERNLPVAGATVRLLPGREGNPAARRTAPSVAGATVRLLPGREGNPAAHRTAPSVAGATVRLLPGRQEAVSNSDGLARLSLASPGRALVIEAGDDSLLVPDLPQGSDGTLAGEAPPSRHAAQARDTLLWHVSDHPRLYRPGDEVCLKGWLRNLPDSAGADLELPRNVAQRIRYTLTRAGREPLASGSCPLDATGAFAAVLRLPASTSPGLLALTLEATDAGGRPVQALGARFWRELRVEEVRRPAFHAAIRVEGGMHLAGEPLVASAEARTYGGAPLARVPVKWTARTAASAYQPPGHDGFSFTRAGKEGDGTSPGMADALRSQSDSFTRAGKEGDGTSPGMADALRSQCDATGRDAVRIHCEGIRVPVEMTLEATVTDPTHQVQGASTTVLVHPASLCVGLRPEAFFEHRDKQVRMSVVVTDLSGRCVADRDVHLQWWREEERLKSLDDEGLCGYVNELQRSRARLDQREMHVVSKEAPIEVVLPTGKGGRWVVLATVRDGQGRVHESGLVLGPHERDSTFGGDGKVVLDRLSYQPGQTARLLVRFPGVGKGVQGLLILSRQGVMESRRFVTDGPSTVLEVTVDDRFVPNVEATVWLVGQEHPASAVLRVEPTTRRLEVVTRCPAQARPGDTVSLDLAVRDAHGQAVPGAQVSVAVVDQSLLDLAPGNVVGQSLLDLAPGNVVDQSLLDLAPGNVVDPLRSFYQERPGGLTWLGTDRARKGPGVLPHGLRRITVHFQGDDLRAVLTLLASEMECGLVMDPSVRGSVTMSLQDVPIEGAVSMITHVSGFDYRVEEGTLIIGNEKCCDCLFTSSCSAARRDAAISLRADMRALAAFRPSVRTDDQGRARVPIRLPDTITRYRVLAVASAGATRFGLSDGTSLEVSRPLVVSVTPPRFVNVGDVFWLPVNVQNQGPRPVEARVALRVRGLRLLEAGAWQVHVPAGDRADWSLACRADVGGTAIIEAVASTTGRVDAAGKALAGATASPTGRADAAGKALAGATASTTGRADAAGKALAGATASTTVQADAVRVTLPVQQPTTSRSFAASGTLGEGALAIPLQVPRDALPDLGALRVVLSTSRACELLDSLDFFSSYRVDCTEQIASRVLTQAALLQTQAAPQDKAERPSQTQAAPQDEAERPSQTQTAPQHKPERLRPSLAAPRDEPTQRRLALVKRDLRAGIRLLVHRQRPDGGFGLWGSEGVAWSFASVHALHALASARDHGFDVPAEALRRGRDHLRSVGRGGGGIHGSAIHGSAILASYALYVRSRLGDHPLAEARSLVHARGAHQLPLQAVGWLLPVVAEDDALVKALHDALATRLRQDPARAWFAGRPGDEEARGDGQVVASPSLDQAVVLRSLVGDPWAAPFLDRLAREVLEARTAGRWGVTTEHAMGVVALQRWFSSQETRGGRATARAWLDHRLLDEAHFDGQTWHHESVVPLGMLDRQVPPRMQRIVLAREGAGPVGYQVVLRCVWPTMGRPADDHGFSVGREYLPLDDPATVRRDADGTWRIAAGARVRVRITVDTHRLARQHVAVTDPLPAGFEPLLDGLGGSEVDLSARSSGRECWFEHRALREDRGEAFSRMLCGKSRFEYTVRATTRGTFGLPPASAEEMYHPDVAGHSNAGRVVVE